MRVRVCMTTRLDYPLYGGCKTCMYVCLCVCVCAAAALCASSSSVYVPGQFKVSFTDDDVRSLVHEKFELAGTNTRRLTNRPSYVLDGTGLE